MTETNDKNITTILDLLKLRLGITSNKRDQILTSIIQGVQSELENQQGYVLDYSRPDILMFMVDICDWRYSNRGENGPLPRHLQFRFHNLEISQGGEV